MKRSLTGLTLALCLTAPAFAADSDQNPAQVMPIDRKTTVQGVEAACTGLGKAERDNPAWDPFPVRIEFADSKSEYVTDVEVRVATAKGKPVAHASCGAPWVLLKLPPGDYRVFGRLLVGGPERSTTFKVPRTGQVRAALTFPEG
ncbi:MAG TPA: hypothetical protein VGM25_05525 [Caulobacteraceae bacterium]|jgi:hypothetical protein